MDFAPFDKRNYPTLSVRDGYREWSQTYDAVVRDEMDLGLLSQIETVAWESVSRALDLACGTGRIGAWLRAHGADFVEGVDFSPEMMAHAKTRKVYDALYHADIQETGLPSETYDLVIEVLADEHLEDLAPLYAEAARVATVAASFVIVGYHSHFLMNGVPTHFDGHDGNPVSIQAYIHLFSDHVKAAHQAGWTLTEMDEGVIDDTWIALKPGWAKYKHQPVSFCMVWSK